MNINLPAILVVNRMSLLRKAKSLGHINSMEPSLRMTHEEVFTRYRGIDGDPWPQKDGLQLSLENGLAPLNSLSIVCEYYRTVISNKECDIIALADPSIAASFMENAGYFFLGFDVGFYDSELAHFSVILNEVLFGFAPDMRAFADRLNESLLLSSTKEAHALLSVHHRLLSIGVPLEDCCSFETIAVYSPIESNRGASLLGG